MSLLADHSRVSAVVTPLITRLMRAFLPVMVVAILTIMHNPINSLARNETPELTSLEGITHYGMAIDEVSKKFVKDDAILEIVYSKNLSDDNMDDYVKQLYEELIRRIEFWISSRKELNKHIKIVISNCKFCKIGYCKKKGLKEIRIISYRNNKEFMRTSVIHRELLEKEKIPKIAERIVSKLLEP